MTTYKAPDVYVEEISLFPPSVAEVETAIAAFIGYTDRALVKGLQKAWFTPTEITSFPDFQETFGGPPPVKVKRVDLDVNNMVTAAEVEAAFYLYDSVRLFFQNGGGKCYIIAVGAFKDNSEPKKQHFKDGLAALRKQDEPTMILFPDAVLLQNDDLYELQQEALNQCGELGDRVAIFDLLESRSGNPAFDWKAGYQEFRDKIGINFLKYGMAYTPYLKTALDKTVRYQDINAALKTPSGARQLKNLTDNADVIRTIETLDYALSDQGIVNGDDNKNGSIGNFLKAKADKASSLKAAYYQKVLDLRTAVNRELSVEDPEARDPDTVRPAFKELFNFSYQVANGLLDQWAKPGTLLTDDAQRQTVVADVRALLKGRAGAALAKLNSWNKNMQERVGGADVNELYKGFTWASPEWGGTFTVEADNDKVYPNHGTSATDYIRNMQGAESKISEQFDILDGVIALVARAAVKRTDTYEETLAAVFPLFKNILAKVSSSLTLIPPSGPIAGIYARVDGTRGVWKAPANVSLSGVNDVTQRLDRNAQEELNVDVVAGKSINVIRPFTGKGIMVWGARTLAGNDNEWRYVSVRRFYNMVEESVRKSTYWAVFEPNDANTWVKVRGMIENYLIQKWREGALAGAAPKDAFFVRCGIGTTMNSVDILEGRMNVEIGMAVVRPAEFIILKFSHLLQTS